MTPVSEVQPSAQYARYPHPNVQYSFLTYNHILYDFSPSAFQTPTRMSRILPNRETTIPAKRSASPDTGVPYRLSRSMTAEIPHSKHLLFDTFELPPPPPSNKRRVNPDSLAIRLGPELVAELESFVQPGVVEMPSFAIRQEIQIRYNVDRRHIYDWFHSKGLRVTKEDKRATVELKTDAMRMQVGHPHCEI